MTENELRLPQSDKEAIRVLWEWGPMLIETSECERWTNPSESSCNGCPSDLGCKKLDVYFALDTIRKEIQTGRTGYHVFIPESQPDCPGTNCPKSGTCFKLQLYLTAKDILAKKQEEAIEGLNEIWAEVIQTGNETELEAIFPRKKLVEAFRTMPQSHSF